MKRLFYIANIRFPTERAHGIQVAKMCEAFARAGTEVTLLVPDRHTLSDDPFSYYGLERNFEIRKVTVPDIVHLGRVGFFIESLLFAYRAVKMTNRNKDAVIYTREELPLLFLPRGRAYYEAHQLRRSFFFRYCRARARRIVSISRGLKEALVATGYPEGKILVAHDGYDARAFASHADKAEVRRRLSLPVEEHIAMYIGGFESWKGLRTLLTASESLKMSGIRVVVIGGAERERVLLAQQYPHVYFLGSRPYAELPDNQSAADVLVIPNSGQERISREFTSPLKLFAHMSSGRPIVASLLPSLCEVLSESNAYLVSPDDPEALAGGVNMAVGDRKGSEKKATQASEDVREYSWDKRADRILRSCL